MLRRLLGKRLCFEKCFLNRSSKYKSLRGRVPLSQSRCVSLSVWVFVSLLVCLWLEMCFLCRTCEAITPSCVAWSARSVCCCYLRSNPALWPHHQQQQQQRSPPPPAFFPFQRHQNVATGTLALIQIFHGHLPAERRRWWRRLGEKGVWEILPKGGGRNVSVISLECGSHECNIILKQNAAIPAQYFKRCLVLMPPCWGHNIDGSNGKC